MRTPLDTAHDKTLRSSASDGVSALIEMAISRLNRLHRFHNAERRSMGGQCGDDPEEF